MFTLVFFVITSRYLLKLILVSCFLFNFYLYNYLKNYVLNLFLFNKSCCNRKDCKNLLFLCVTLFSKQIMI